MMHDSMNRRAFLTGGGGLLVVSRHACAAVASARVQPCPPSAWRKQGLILRHQGEPKAGVLQNFTSPAEPLEADRWRLWISLSGKGVSFNVGYAEGRQGEPWKQVFAQLSPGEPPEGPLSIGNLPKGWRPVQGVHLRLKDGRHRLYFWAHAQRIVRYLAADSDNGRQFRVIDPLCACLYHPADRAVDGAAAMEAGLSRRGKQKAAPVAGEPLAPARLISNDATNVYQLPDGSFEMYSVALLEVPKDDPRYIAHDNVAGWVRVIDRYASEDGLQWTDRRRVIVPDAGDPTDQQFYYLAVTHTEKGRVGILGHYRVQAQTMDMEWCFSKDGIEWERPARRPWLPRGNPGEIDSFMVYASHNLVWHQDRWWHFYTGANYGHNHRESHGPPDRGVFLATAGTIWG